MPRAVSNYKQCRITLTEEAGGHVTVRVLVKPLAADWSTKQLVLSRRMSHVPAIQSTTDMYRLLIAFLSEEPLPDSHNG